MQNYLRPLSNWVNFFTLFMVTILTLPLLLGACDDSDVNAGSFQPTTNTAQTTNAIVWTVVTTKPAIQKGITTPTIAPTATSTPARTPTPTNTPTVTPTPTPTLTLTPIIVLSQQERDQLVSDRSNLAKGLDKILSRLHDIDVVAQVIVGALEKIPGVGTPVKLLIELLKKYLPLPIRDALEKFISTVECLPHPALCALKFFLKYVDSLVSPVHDSFKAALAKLDDVINTSDASLDSSKIAAAITALSNLRTSMRASYDLVKKVAEDAASKGWVPKLLKNKLETLVQSFEDQFALIDKDLKILEAAKGRADARAKRK